MLKELKSPQKDSAAWCSLSDKLQMAEVSIPFIFPQILKPICFPRTPWQQSER